MLLHLHIISMRQINNECILNVISMYYVYYMIISIIYVMNTVCP